MASFQVPQGDPAGLRAAAKQFSRLAGDHAALAASLAQHAQQASDGWKGGFADRFRQCAQAVHTRFQPVSKAAMSVSQELNTYAAALEAAQHTVSSLNHQADTLSRQHQQHADPAAKAQAMSQLGQQASTAASSANHAAQVCAARIAAAEGQLGGALPDTMSLKQLQDEVQRASAELKKEDPSAWEKIFGPEGLLRTWDERLHALPAPFADMVLIKMMHSAESAKDVAEEASKFADEIPALMEADFPDRVLPVMQDMSRGEATFADLVDTLRSFSSDWSAIDHYTSALKAANEAEAARLPFLKGAGFGLGALSIIGDAYSIAKPADSGVMGHVDQGVAAVNLGLTGTDMAVAAGVFGAEASMPIIGEVAMVGTGLFLAGDWAYHTFKPFHDFCNDVGHTAVSVAKGAWNAVTSIF